MFDIRFGHIHVYLQGQYFQYFFPFVCNIFLVILFALVVFAFNAFLVYIFATAPGISVLQARESNSLSDDRREPRLFLYCSHTTTLSFRLQFPIVSVFPSDGSRE